MSAPAFASIAANALAAVLWLLSALLPRFPAKVSGPNGAPSSELRTLARGLKLQGLLSAAAAVCAAVGVTLAAVIAGGAHA